MLNLCHIKYNRFNMIFYIFQGLIRTELVNDELNVTVILRASQAIQEVSEKVQLHIV